MKQNKIRILGYSQHKNKPDLLTSIQNLTYSHRGKELRICLCTLTYISSIYLVVLFFRENAISFSFQMSRLEHIPHPSIHT